MASVDKKEQKVLQYLSKLSISEDEPLRDVEKPKRLPKPVKFTFSSSDIARSSKLRDLIFDWPPGSVELLPKTKLRRKFTGPPGSEVASPERGARGIMETTIVEREESSDGDQEQDLDLDGVELPKFVVPQPDEEPGAEAMPDGQNGSQSGDLSATSRFRSGSAPARMAMPQPRRVRSPTIRPRSKITSTGKRMPRYPTPAASATNLNIETPRRMQAAAAAAAQAQQQQQDSAVSSSSSGSLATGSSQLVSGISDPSNHLLRVPSPDRKQSLYFAQLQSQSLSHTVGDTKTRTAGVYAEGPHIDTPTPSRGIIPNDQVQPISRNTSQSVGAQVNVTTTGGTVSSSSGSNAAAAAAGPAVNFNLDLNSAIGAIGAGRGAIGSSTLLLQQSAAALQKSQSSYGAREEALRLKRERAIERLKSARLHNQPVEIDVEIDEETPLMRGVANTTTIGSITSASKASVTAATNASGPKQQTATA